MGQRKLTDHWRMPSGSPTELQMRDCQWKLWTCPCCAGLVGPLSVGLGGVPWHREVSEGPGSYTGLRLAALLWTVCGPFPQAWAQQTDRATQELLRQQARAGTAEQQESAPEVRLECEGGLIRAACQ